MLGELQLAKSKFVIENVTFWETGVSAIITANTQIKKDKHVKEFYRFETGPYEKLLMYLFQRSCRM